MTDIMRDSRMSMTPRRRAPLWVSLLAVGAVLVAGCSSDPAPLEDLDGFKKESKARVLDAKSGGYGGVPAISGGLSEEYNDQPLVETSDPIWGSKNNATLSARPRRFELDFSKGDGTGADTVCRDVKVPKDTKYVFVVKNSGRDVTAQLDAEGELVPEDDEEKPELRELHLCFDPDDHPNNVMAWFDNTPR